MEILGGEGVTVIDIWTFEIERTSLSVSQVELNSFITYIVVVLTCSDYRKFIS